MAKNIEDTLSKISDKVDELQKSTHHIDKEVALQKAAFEDLLEQHKRMLEEFKRSNDILQSNTESLKEHMHRTDLLEQLVSKMDVRITPLETAKIAEDAVLKHKQDMLIKYGKIGAAIVTAIGILAALKPLIIDALSKL